MKPWRMIALFAVLIGAVFFLFKPGRQQGDSRSVDLDLLVEDLVACEEWIDLMGRALAQKGEEISKVSAEGAILESCFKEGFEPSGSALGVGFPKRGESSSLVTWTDYGFSKEEEAEGGLWWFLAENLGEVSEVKFAFLSGEFRDEERTGFHARVVFSAKGGFADGGIGYLESEQEITWALGQGGVVPSSSNDYLIDPDDWKIVGWRLDRARLIRSEASLFQEVTEEVIPSQDDRLLIDATDHGRYLEKLFGGGTIPLKSGYGRYFTTDATAQHPAVSVVDINGDGRDDFYVCVRWGRNLLFRDIGDGTFEEVAAEYGLDVGGLSSSAIFADFDNDGDQDVFIGRSLERSLYFRNEGGEFIDCSGSHVSSPLPYLTSSMATADFNGDGLLDLYFATYGFAIRQPREQVAKDFLNEDYAPEEVRARFVDPAEYEPYLDLPGPPNVLLVNLGDGRFERSGLSDQVAVWHETLQATWADYDLDGDPDLYVCNDFAPDQLFRNDGGTGFVDVTSTEGHERMRGFGMGASFGDFDNDLDLDLYVSNMFSKAGLRVIEKAGLEDERFRWSAEGNLLFGGQGGKGFEFLSGKGSPYAVTARADWSWGGQFFDFDNDGFLDLYVPNGYFTAPEKFAGEVDL